MKPLTIELKKGTPLQFQSVAWKTAKPDDCSREFYALDQTGKPVVVTPKPALLDFYDPLRQACEPFPAAVCIEISPCRLLPPPCYESREDFDAQLPCHSTFEPWKWRYWQTHGQVLIAEPSDNGPLQERLDKWRAAIRADHEHESAEWRKRIKQVALCALFLGVKTKFLHWLGVLQLFGELRAGVPCKDRLKLTMNKVKRGYEGIRDAWMHEDWANKNGMDLGVMRHERNVFRRWLETHTGTPIAPPSERYEQDPRFLEACASIRYRARFADNANTVVFLADCELRKEPTAKERDEVARLRGVVDLQAAKEPPPWHSDNWREVYLHDQTGQRKDKATLHNSLRALCLLLKDDIGKAKPYTEIEPQIGARAGSLDKENNVDPPSPKGPRRIYDLLRTTAGKKLEEWGVLVTSGAREKFIKLSPPQAK